MKFNQIPVKQRTKENLVKFLNKSRDWSKAIPLLNAIEDHQEFNTWLQVGSTVRLIEICGDLPDEVIDDLYKDRGGRDNSSILDPLPYNNDRHALDTARSYMVDFGLSHVDDPKKFHQGD